MLYQRFHPWFIRLLLAALLAFGSEILLWNVPYARAALGWARTALGYVLVAALLLDLAARYRPRDIFGALLLAGVYATVNALAISPQTTLYELPRTLATRVLGPHALVGLGMMALLLWLAGRGRSSWLALATLPVGIAAGAWARWSPVVLSAADETALAQIYSAAAVAAVIIAFLAWALARRQTESATPEFRLHPLEWIVVAGGLLALVASNYADGDMNTLALAVTAGLLALCWAALWATARMKGAAYVDLLAVFEPRWRWLGIGLLILAGAAALGWSLPRGEGIADPVAVIGGVMTAFGIVWLPTVALVLGARALQRQTRALRL
ncbi:MAG: hypothetical protein KJ065_21885 [Anaerolineae bacterium]|nr:hypothetical protein [Anaerolineae bacterium]